MTSIDYNIPMRRKSSLAARLTLLTLLAPASGFAGTRAGSCYPVAGGGSPRPLSENRDRLISDLARRKLTSSCALWASLNKAERYIFLMDTAYLGDKSSRLYPPADGNLETALDHAVALYSINGPKAGQGTDGSGRGGMDYNRIFIGFDALGACVLRNFSAANPKRDPEFNRWQSSDDTSGPHAPFNQREMIFWDNWLNSNSLGPQIHHWHRDADFNQAGIDKRRGLCGVKDPTLTELTVAFDFFHNSNPLGDYSGRGGFGWQIVDKHISVSAQWDYTPSGCSVTPPLNDSEDGGGTFNGLGPARGAECAEPGSDNDP
jgi:hypothetical protein